MTMLLLMHYDLKLKNQMKTDASKHAVTGIYTQLQMSEQWHFVIYWLQKLSSMKNNYEIHDLKLLAIVETFKQWCHYLKSNKYSVKILTDHNNLCEFMNVKTLNKRQAQWAVKLAAFDFVIMHRSNKINLINASSRHPDYIQIINESIDRLLSILQRKLAAMSAIIFKFLMIISCLEIICHVYEEQNDMRSRESQLNWYILRKQRDEQSLVH